MAQVRGLWGEYHDGTVLQTYRQGEHVNETFFKALEEASEAQDLVLMGEFNLPDMCWKSSMVAHQ